MKVRKRVKNKKKKKKKETLIKWVVRDSLKHKPWVSSKVGKRNWMNDLLFHMDDTTMMRTWWDEKANIGLEKLSNHGSKDERPSFCYPLLQWEIVSTC